MSNPDYFSNLKKFVNNLDEEKVDTFFDRLQTAFERHGKRMETERIQTEIDLRERSGWQHMERQIIENQLLPSQRIAAHDYRYQMAAQYIPPKKQLIEPELHIFYTYNVYSRAEIDELERDKGIWCMELHDTCLMFYRMSEPATQPKFKQEKG
jgi:hypothetical protein